MKKKFLSVLIACAVIIQIFPLAFAAGEITIGTPKFEGGKIKISVIVDQVGKSYSMLVVRQGGDPNNLADRYAMCEEVSNENKIVTFIFKMPETRSDLVSESNPNGYTDGVYTITVKGNNTGKASLDFDFATEANKTIAINKLIGATTAVAVESYLKPDSEIRNVLVNLEFDFLKYDQLSDPIKSKIADLFFKNIPYNGENIGDVFNSVVRMVLVNESDDNIAECLSDSVYSFEGRKYGDLDVKLQNWVVRVYSGNRIFSEITEFENTYKIANILYKINNSKFDTVGTIISNYAAELGITTDKVYTEYNALKLADRLATGENLITSLSNNPSISVKSLISAIKSSITYTPTDKENKYSENLQSGFTISKSDTVNEITTDNIQITLDVFTDIASVLWAKDAIKYLYDRNIVSGMGDGTFNPDGFIKREEFAKMAVDAIGIHNSQADSDFYDVSADSWYASYVASAQNNGIISGIGNEMFGVGKYITRQDVAVIIAKCANYLGIMLEKGLSDSFDDDSSISEYARESVYSLVESNIISGVGENLFDPAGNCTRAQAARLIYMLLTYVQAEPEKVNDIDSEMVSKFKFLSGLGMFPGATADMIDIKSSILKGKFIQNAMRLVCGEDIQDNDLLEVAKGYGIAVSADYDYEAYMSYDEAVSVVLRLSTMETYESNIDTSLVEKYKFEVSKNISEKGSVPITLGSVINLLYNAAKYEGVMTQNAPMEYSFVNNTIIEEKRNITIVKGIVTENETTSINGVSSVKSGEVKIDGVTALEGKSEAGKYIGKSVTAYVYFGDDHNKVIYIEENSNTKELTISSDDFESVDMSARIIKYESGKGIKSARYSPSVKVIKNGKYYSAYTQSDIEIPNGSIRLVDNDYDGVYDIIFIERYSYVVVSGVIPSKYVIRSAYTKDTTIIPSTFDFYEVDDCSIIFKGEKVEISDIQQNDLLSIMSTGTSSNDRVIIYISRDKVTGKITAKNPGENKISIDGKEYKFSNAYLEAGKTTADSAYLDPEFNVQYDFYLDYFGKVAYIEESKMSDEFSYVYAKKVYKSRENGEETHGLYYFTLNSEWKKTEFAEKVRYNGTSYKRDELVTALGTFTADVYKIQLNADEKISAINDSNKLNKQTVTGKWSINTFGLVDTGIGGGMLMFLDGNSKVFLIPTSGEDDEYAVGNRGRFSSDRTYTITGYGFDDFKKADVVVYSKPTSVAADSAIVVVDKVINTLIDDEVLPVLYGVAKGKENYSVVAAKQGVFDGVNKGDLITISTNSIERVEKILKIFSPPLTPTKMTSKQINTETAVFEDSEFNKSPVFAAGNVTAIDYGTKKMIVDTGIAGGQLINGKNDVVIPNVVIYNKADDEIELGSFDSIVKGDYVFMRFDWTRLETVYILR
jgi:hypothetical protein